MKTPSSPSPVRGFTHVSRAWYASSWLSTTNLIDEIVFGLYFPDGGTSGEMTVKWSMLAGRPTAKLNVFHDAWMALSQMPDLVAALGALPERESNITPSQFTALLLSLGFTDLTETVNPRA